ncbi:MAG: PT domain-containing protein [Clostridia bacterium]|nr:PT domain-containing protein [Clostridia bacterium]
MKTLSFRGFFFCPEGPLEAKLRARFSARLAPTAAPTVEPTVAPTVAPTAEPTVAPTVAPVAPKYEVKVDGKHGSIARVNDTSVIYEDLYIRYSIGHDMGGTSYAVIAMLKVDWAETQEGAVGTFTIPRIQGSGTVTGASYIVTTNENADGLSLAGAVKNSCGMLIQ